MHNNDLYHCRLPFVTIRSIRLVGPNISIYLRVISCDLNGSLMEKLGKYFLKGSSRVLTFFSW